MPTLEALLDLRVTMEHLNKSIADRQEGVPAGLRLVIDILRLAAYLNKFSVRESALQLKAAEHCADSAMSLMKNASNPSQH